MCRQTSTAITIHKSLSFPTWFSTLCEKFTLDLHVLYWTTLFFSDYTSTSLHVCIIVSWLQWIILAFPTWFSALCEKCTLDLLVLYWLVLYWTTLFSSEYTIVLSWFWVYFTCLPSRLCVQLRIPAVLFHFYCRSRISKQFLYTSLRLQSWRFLYCTWKPNWWLLLTSTIWCKYYQWCKSVLCQQVFALVLMLQPVFINRATPPVMWCVASNHNTTFRGVVHSCHMIGYK